MPRKKTNEEFLILMKEKKPDIIPLEKYIRRDISIKFQCKICGNVFYNSPDKILGSRNQGCAKCYTNSLKTSNEDFQTRANKNKHIKVVGEYTGIKNKIEVKCVYCGKVFFMRADSILEGRGHNSCIHKNIEKDIKREPSKTQEKFVSELNSINKNIEPLELYTKTSNKMLFRCKTCGNEWNARIDHVLYGQSGCPKCNLSKGENRIANYLQDKNIKFISQYTFDDCRDKIPLPFDFYLPKYNICIEYDGEQHFREVEHFRYSLDYIQNHDNTKNLYCKENNIRLIRIPYTDFDNIERLLDEFIK